MIIKHRKPPIPLQTIDAIIARLPEGHSQLEELRYQAAIYQKGYNGERKLDYHIRSLPDSFSILNDVTLTVFDNQFQIDSLLITAHAIYIIEVKSLEGIVTFDPTLKQLTQNNGQKVEGRKYPITQVENIQFHLLRWLQLHNLDGLPIYYFIAFSEQSTIVKVTGEEEAIRKVVSHVDEIPIRLMKLDGKLAQKKSGDNQRKNQIVHTVLRHCEDFTKNIISHHQINKRDILPGVHCPNCNTLGMVRLRYKWQCEKCGNFSLDTHLNALHDWTLIYGNKITNKQCRYFLKVKRTTAYSLLKGAEFKYCKKEDIWLIDPDKLK